jgi:acyl-CoA hydrolase
MTGQASEQVLKDKSNDYGFPSHFLPLEKKNKTWHLQYMKAFHREFTSGNAMILRWAYQDYQKWRLYARGKQPIDQYKELLGVVKRHGKKDQSWRNLDWNILPVFPRFKTVIKNRLLKIPKDIILTAIDQVSSTKERKRKSEIMEYITNKEFLNSLPPIDGHSVQSPFEPGEVIPHNSNEVDLYVDMYPKNKYIMHMKDQIELSFLLSDWKELEVQLMDDIIDLGLAATRTFMDNLGRIRIKKRNPEQTITNTCTKVDFSDMIRVGEYTIITISELRQSVPKNTFSTQDYANIANAATKKNYYTAMGADSYFLTHNRYPWDHERITVLEAEFFSASDVAYVVAPNKKGKKTVTKKDNPYWLDKQGIGDEQYLEYYKKKGEDRELIRDTVNMVHQAYWIVDTNYIYNYGPQHDMIRSVRSLFDCELGTAMYTLDFDSIVRQCEPILDNIQINWLNYQHALAQIKPSGLAIERRALQAVTVGNKKLSIQDIIQMYAETGSMIYVGTDQNGRPYPFKPLEKIMGDTPEAAQGFLNLIVQQIDLLRSILGLNEITDSSTPDPKTGKSLAQMVEGNTNNALGNIWHAYINLYEKTARKVCLLVPDAQTLGRNPGVEEALGDRRDMVVNKDMNLLDFGIKVDAGIDTEMRQRLFQHLNANLKASGGVLQPQDAFLIENENNLQRAYLLLEQKIRQRQNEQQQAEIQKMNAQAQGNVQAAQQAEEEKRKTMQLDLEVYREKSMIDLEKETTILREKAQLDYILQKTIKGMDLTAKEAELMANLNEAELKGHIDLLKTKMLTEAKNKVQVRS